MKKSIAVDMDDVLAGIESHMIAWYEQEYGVRVPYEALQGVEEGRAFPDFDKVRALLYKEGFFRSAPVISGAKEALKQLNDDFDVYIVSAAMEFPQSLSEKKAWLTEHFPFIHWKQIVFCGDKSIIDTDYMIDDHLKNLNYCKGRGILFTAGHNSHLNYDVRVNNWQEAKSYLYN